MAARALIGLSFAGFIALGMPEGALGVAWPSLASEFERPLGELGLLLVVYTSGYLLSTASNGWLMRRFGVGRMLPVSSAIAAATLAVYAGTGRWPVLVSASFLLGAAGGLIDAGVNAYTALRHGSRVMNLLHASFGLGATLGPFVMTFAIDTGSYRTGYGLLAAVQALLAAAFWVSRHRWSIPPPSSEQPGRAGRRPLLAASLAVFFLYTGVEVATGQWAFTLLTLDRGIDPVPAGLLVTAYWGSFTLGRLITAGIGDRRRPEAMVGAGMAAALGGALLLWWSPTDWLGAAGLMITGLSLAPIFPLLTLLTPGRLGSSYAPTAIGFQLAAASVGAATLPGLIGLAVNRSGPGAIGWLLALFAGLLAVSGIVLAAPGRRPVGYGGAS
ncbi:MAG: MFS transporter [Acidimicrobiia bacterium]|nr:MFS transporter [Acidimicrobiia bacterium]NNF08868.1 MFS transporter [Acidimicrobiia bacterium]NNL70949.1 MFS transporter [Acidimicrobiia bacterium]